MPLKLAGKGLGVIFSLRYFKMAILDFEFVD